MDEESDLLPNQRSAAVGLNWLKLAMDLNDSSNWLKLAMDEESDLLPNQCGRRVDGGVDRISQLPDEIIVVILSLLSLREAATTSVLSSRWSDLWKHTPNLEFDTLHPKPSNSDDDDSSDDDDNGLWEAKRCKYIETVNSVIRSHKALSLKKFRISLFVEKSDKCAVPKWLKFVLSRQVESLELNTSIDDSDMGVFKEWLREESIICRAPETLVFFQSLKRLCLRLVNVSGEDIKLFLRNCPLLEQLMIKMGFLTSDVEVCGANLMLKHLEILEIYCKGEPKSIKVSAPNLTRIEFSDLSGTLSFENVPKLVEAFFIIKHSPFPIRHFASAASCYLSQLQSLELLISYPKVFWMSGFPEMPNLKKLVIVISEAYSHSLLPLTALIWASPRLEEIKIQFSGGLRDSTAWMEGLTNAERSPHQHLKVFAFQMSSRQYMGISDRVVELVTYILDYCVALQKITIGSTLYQVYQITAEMLADAVDLTQQLQAKVPNHIQLELPYSILQ